MSTTFEFDQNFHHPREPTVFCEDSERYCVNEGACLRESTPHHRHPQKELKEQNQTRPDHSGCCSGCRSFKREDRRDSSSLMEKDDVKMIPCERSNAKRPERGWCCLSGRGRGFTWKKSSIIVLGVLASVVFVDLVAISAARIMLPYPKKASCQVNVTFHDGNFLNCDAVKSAIVLQMKKWESRENCKNGGMKCLYKVEDVGPDTLTGTHQTSDWFGFIDKMKFTFSDTAEGNCFVEAFSHSTVPFAYLDFSVNYCNIHNLVDAVAGNGPNKFSEVTRDQVCTQYSSANCEKY